MSNDLAHLQSMLAARMRERGVPLTDPRLAPLLGQLQGLMRQRLAQAEGNGGVVLHERPAEASPHPNPPPQAGEGREGAEPGRRRPVGRRT